VGRACGLQTAGGRRCGQQGGQRKQLGRNRSGWRLAGRGGVVEVIISGLSRMAREAQEEVVVHQEMRARTPESEAVAS